MAEWSSCRDAISKFDDRLDSVRKLGFTFITVLFTANSLLGQIVGNFSGAVLGNNVKLAIFGAILLLIVGIRLIDSIYRTFQGAISVRARVLEVRLNLELTETISERYGHGRTSWFIEALYYVFCAAVFLIGSVALSPTTNTFQAFADSYSVQLLLGFTVVTMVTVALIGLFVSPKGTWPDWTIDKVTCMKGESVRIILTNLGSKQLLFKRDDLAWQIQNETNPEANDELGKLAGKFLETVTLQNGDSYDWLWPTKDCEPGIYRIVPANSNSLHRKVRITDSRQPLSPDPRSLIGAESVNDRLK